MDEDTKLILIELGEKIAELLEIAETIKDDKTIKDNSFEIGYLNGVCKGLKESLMRIDIRFR